MNPKISIIVPIYNVERYLERCVQSLVNQTLKEIEIILIDDGSSDRSPMMCDVWAEKDNRIKVIHKKNAGLGFARNSGIEIASGEYLGFVDSDDYVDINMFQSLYETALKHESEIVLSGYYYESYLKTITKQIVQQVEHYSGEETFQALLNLISSKPDAKQDMVFGFPVWRSIYSKNVIDLHSIRFCSERQYISEDVIFHIELVPKVNKLTVIPKCYYHYCANEDSLTKTYRKDRIEKDLMLVREVRRRLDLIPTIPPFQDIVDRMLIARVRVAVDAEVTFINQNGLSNCIRNIKQMIRNEEILQILKRYPSGELPFQQRMFIVICKLQQPILLTILLLIYRKIR